MTSRKAFAALALIASFGVTACNGDPEPAPPAGMDPGQQMPQQEVDPEAMALMMEAQEIQQQLGPIQEEAMQDEALVGQLDDLRDRIEAAMREEAPGLLAQMEELEAEFIAAQQAGDQERAQEIGMEAQELDMELQAVQQSVLERPEIGESIDAFEEAQRARMIEIDPAAGDLLDRFEEVIAQMGMP